MTKRTMIYTRRQSRDTDAGPDSLRQAVEGRGDVVAGVYADDGQITGKGKNAGWRALITKLADIDQIVVATAGDLPGRTVNDLFAVLGILREHGVSLYLHREGIDTGTGPAAILDLVAAYRAAKLSQAIRHGQAKARAAGKKIGRPAIPVRVVVRIQAALALGEGVRPIARKFGVAPASVINIRHAMTTSVAAA